MGVPLDLLAAIAFAAENLRADGHTVIAIVEMEPGVSDETVFEIANQQSQLQKS